ncbi:MAG: DNA polymerase III subunit alpha [Patescibacteria group bacterium]|nr:DNA polymerase III subunit alpha [Patescibacteria group bacterium]
MSKFIHLHCHSHYSLLQALPQVDDLAKRAKKMGCEAVALTDYAALYGVIEFYKACKKQEIKPIIGIECYMAPFKMTDKRPRIDDRPSQIVLIAETTEGYKNLIKISTAAHLDGFYYKPRVDKDLLRQYHEGLICLSGGLKGDVAKALEGLDNDKAEALASEYADIFGADNFFIELQDHPELDEQTARNRDLLTLARKLKLPVVATKDVHYLDPDDAEAHDVLICIGAGKTVQQDDRARLLGTDYSFVSPEHMVEAFADVPEAIENTVKIAERCNVEIELGKWKFPEYLIPAGKTHDDVLRERAYAGVKEKLGEVTPAMAERLDYELGVIEKKGYAVYFLVVSDYVAWSRKQGIISTTRGSAAGSLVSYGVDIVPVNPLFFKLPFERFLNPFRPSAPDIDVDIADNRRDEVIAYVTEKYGKDRVAQIGTFGTMAARAAVRDVGRALGLPYAFVDRVAKLIPMGSQGFAMTIDRAVEMTPELKQLAEDDPSVQQMLGFARKIEGCARHCSVHAAGVVIAPAPLTEYVPLQHEPGGEKIITQFDMNAVGEDGAGVLKMDFLGIRNLSILGLAVETVKRTKGVEVALKDLKFDDKKTYELLAAGHTVGVFQLAGSGMTKYLMDLKPTNIFDIMAMVALYRPGPIESIPEYIRRKNGISPVDYPEPRLKEILTESYGLLVYQDDVMLTAIKLAGYDWMEADKFRKAMGKKIPEEMAKQEVKFREGCAKNGVAAKTIDNLWELIKPFAAYGFNKAHAASYAVVSYQTAYMKANYPAEYMTAIMTAESGDAEKVAAVVGECVRMGIQVLPPDVNSSEANFTYIDDQTIRFGLLAIKNLGSDTVEAVVAERKANGPFKNVADLAARVNSKGFNKKSLEAMIKAGAMDSLGERNLLLGNLDNILAYHKNAQRDSDSGQSNLFAIAGADTKAVTERTEIPFRPFPPASKREKLAWEKELLGLYVSEHPFKEFSDFFGKAIVPVVNLAQHKNQRGLVRLGGYIFNAKEIITKKGDPMSFIQMGDLTGNIEVIVFPSVYGQDKAAWLPDQAVIVEGKYEEKDGEPKILAEKAYVVTPENAEELRAMLVTAGRHYGGAVAPVGAALATDSQDLRLLVPALMSPSFATELKRVLGEYPGSRRVVFVVRASGQAEKRIETKTSVGLSNDLIRDVEAVLGRGAVLGE